MAVAEQTVVSQTRDPVLMLSITVTGMASGWNCSHPPENTHFTSGYVLALEPQWELGSAFKDSFLFLAWFDCRYRCKWLHRKPHHRIDC